MAKDNRSSFGLWSNGIDKFYSRFQKNGPAKNCIGKILWSKHISNFFKDKTSTCFTHDKCRLTGRGNFWPNYCRIV